MNRLALIGLYLAAIVAANLSVERWGVEAAIYNAFFLIGLDLVTRDALHDLWREHLARNMAALIVAGSALSYLVNRDTARIALASCVAFGAASLVDAVVYHLRRDRPWLERVNTSNLGGAAVDSVIFPWIAFGSFTWAVVFGLFCAKVAGGVVWALILERSPGQEWLARNRELYGRGSP